MEWTLAVLLLANFAHAERVRHVVMKRDQIALVKTAIGVATIIQVPDSPTSLVVGDSDAFKVEYLEQAITIKPTHFSAKSNLYIYTEYRRFDVQLITVGEPSADYVVYLQNETADLKKSPGLKWKDMTLGFKNDELSFKVKRIAQNGQSVFVEFEVRSLSKLRFDPAWIWMTQKRTVPIQKLTMSGTSLESGHPIYGMIEILETDLNREMNFSLELRRKKISVIKLPRVSQWRR